MDKHDRGCHVYFSIIYTVKENRMETITLTLDNIEKEHICCAMSAKDNQATSKKEWLKERIQEGLVFTKLNERGKCFIEYIPIEKAWIHLTGKDYMYINCLWVSGKFQGHGYAKELLKKCILDSQAKGKKGLVILSSPKKKSFLMDYDFLIKQGFYSVDKWNEEYELLFYPFEDGQPAPKFMIEDVKEDGLVLYYTHQCPFNIKYVQEIKEYCIKQNIPLTIHHLQTREQALQAPTPMTTYSLFYQKKFMTREVLNVRKLEKIWSEIHE